MSNEWKQNHSIMKLKNLLFFSMAIFGIVLISSCEKEDRIIKNLWNNGGEWQVNVYSINVVSSDPMQNYNQSTGGHGTFYFSKNRSGYSVLQGYSGMVTTQFTYTATEDKLTLLSSNSKDEYDLSWKKDEVDISITKTYESFGETFTSNQNYKLIKKQFSNKCGSALT
jgi:hypothetical protein